MSVVAPGSVEVARVERWLGAMVWEDEARAADLFRYKGVLHVRGSSAQHVLQGVHELFEISESRPWPADDVARLNRLVFIGRNLNRDELRVSFEAHCLLGDGTVESLK